MADLGSAEAFREWTTKPRPWGEGASVAFGGGVINHLIAGLDGADAAIGCVPWFTSNAVAERFEPMKTCIIVDKRALTGGDRRVIDRLLAKDWEESGFPVDALRRDSVSMLLRHDGTENYEPIRVAGRARPKSGGWAPLVHAKLLVVGRLHYREYEADTGAGPAYWHRYSFHPMRAWVGSANCTHSATAGIELGMWITEPLFVAEATAFLSDLILNYSEAPGSASELPAPERFTDESEYWADFEPDYDFIARPNESFEG